MNLCSKLFSNKLQAKFIVCIAAILVICGCAKKHNSSGELLPSTADLNGLSIFDDTPPPTMLSELKLFSEPSDLKLISGFIPYEVNQGFWSDGADKTRWVYINPQKEIEVGTEGYLIIPNNSIVIKHFSLSDRNGPIPVETRLLVKKIGVWQALSYRWNADKTDAVLVEKPMQETFTWLTFQGETKEIDWFFAGGTCQYCHNAATETVAGLSLPQLDREVSYGHNSIHQLTAWEQLGWLSSSIVDEQRQGFVTPRIDDSTTPISVRARSYLDINCSVCHRPNGREASLDLRYDADLSKYLNAEPRFGDLGIDGAKIISTDPRTSLIFLRMQRTDKYHMPYISSHVADTQALDLLEKWIVSGEF